jgi:hypothetical protein
LERGIRIGIIRRYVVHAPIEPEQFRQRDRSAGLSIGDNMTGMLKYAPTAKRGERFPLRRRPCRRGSPQRGNVLVREWFEMRTTVDS